MQPSRTLEYGSNGSAHEHESRSPSLRLPLARLLQLLMILQSERFPNARRLADACAVSRRTIYRDLATLEAAGIAVLYHPERQGYQLDRDYWLQPTRLEDNEALSLLIMSRIGCAQIPVGLLRHARSGLVKVVQGLPGELRNRITNSSELIADEAPALDLGPERQAIHETILSALSQRRRLSSVVSYARTRAPSWRPSSACSAWPGFAANGVWSAIPRPTVKSGFSRSRASSGSS